MNAPLDDEERETAELLAQLKVTPSPAARERAFAKLQQDFQAQQAPQPRRTRARWAIAAGGWRFARGRQLAARRRGRRRVVATVTRSDRAPGCQLTRHFERGG